MKILILFSNVETILLLLLWINAIFVIKTHEERDLVNYAARTIAMSIMSIESDKLHIISRHH
jgi:hypothetical protein